MLAVSRSPRETRFLMHSRDTALFYNEMSNFLGEDSSLHELWRSTIDCQRYHDESQEPNWEKSLRYALCVVVGTRGLTVNNRSPDELVRTAVNILFRSSSPNGLFPGTLVHSVDGKLQGLFSEESQRDAYYHAGFEIAYVLLTHAHQVSHVLERIASPKNKATQSEPNPDTSLEDRIRSLGLTSTMRSPQSQHRINVWPGDAEQRQMLLWLSNVLLGRSTIASQDDQEACRDVMRATTHQRLAMKKSIPFNHFIDSNNIIKLEDEWMFNYPDFFMRERCLHEDDYAKAEEELSGQWIPSETSSKRTASEGYVRYSNILTRIFLTTVNRTCGSELRFHVIDIPSRKLTGGKNVELTYASGSDHDELREALGRIREARSAKKRLIYFSAATKDATSICYASTEVSERENLHGFFEKHFRYDKHSMDQCSMVYNFWETEFHLSYFQLRKDALTLRGIPPLKIQKFPGGRGKSIVRTSVGFRFKGDFFDRFWTCCLLEYTQESSMIPVPDELLENKEYHQRKILEEYFFAGILKSLTQSVREILTEIKDCLDIKAGSFSTSISSNAAYTSWSAVWRDFEPLIQTLEDDLASTKITIDQWESREEDRGKEQPRWTRNDERKHRASITKVRQDVKHQKDKLKHLQVNVKLLRESYSNGLVKAREELSFRSEQNIAMFTYVTVVFLPLGFTASIFSMSGSPERSLAINMVVASVIALAVTILALMNAKGLAGVLENISTSFKDLTDDAKRSSVLIRDRQNEKEKAIAIKNGDPKPPHVRVSPTDAIPWDLVFWTGYLFIELPSRSITAACGALGWPQDNPRDTKGLVVAAARQLAHGVRMCLRSGEDTMGDPESHQRASERPTAESVAQKNIGACDQQHRGKNEYFQKIARVLLGLIIVPVFLPLWILQMLCFYAWDTLALLGGTYFSV